MFWKKEAEERDIDLNPEFLKKISGSGREDALSLIEQYYGVSDGTEIYDGCVRRTRDYCLKYVKEKPGAHELLAYMKEKNVKMAVASSSEIELVQNNLARLHLIQYFDALVSGNGMVHCKPAPDIFLKACEKISLPPEDCYVFEDAYNGVRAGHAAGCFTVMVPDAVEPDEEMRQKADAICTSLYEVKDRMERGEF